MNTQTPRTTRPITFTFVAHGGAVATGSAVTAFVPAKKGKK